MKKSVLDQKMPDKMGVDLNMYKTVETEDSMAEWVQEEERAELYQEYEKYERALDKYTHKESLKDTSGDTHRMAKQLKKESQFYKDNIFNQGGKNNSSK